MVLFMTVKCIDYILVIDKNEYILNRLKILSVNLFGTNYF